MEKLSGLRDPCSPVTPLYRLSYHPHSLSMPPVAQVDEQHCYLHDSPKTYTTDMFTHQHWLRQWLFTFILLTNISSNILKKWQQDKSSAGPSSACACISPAWWAVISAAFSLLLLTFSSSVEWLWDWTSIWVGVFIISCAGRNNMKCFCSQIYEDSRKWLCPLCQSLPVILCHPLSDNQSSR